MHSASEIKKSTVEETYFFAFLIFLPETFDKMNLLAFKYNIIQNGTEKLI